MMKKLIILIIIAGLTIGSSMAQKAIELTGFYGYSFNSKINSYYGQFKVKDSPNYGGILGVAVTPDKFIELMYNRTDTRLDYYYAGNTDVLDISTEYYQVGAMQLFGPGNIKPFVGVTLGMARFNLKESSAELVAGDAFRFAATLGAGAKILLSDRLGIRLQARLGVPMQMNGMYFGAGTGGFSTGVGFQIPMVQFDLSAGLILRLGN